MVKQERQNDLFYHLAPRKSKKINDVVQIYLHDGNHFLGQI